MQNFWQLLGRLLAFPIKLLIWVYKYVVSPWLPNSCRYTPSCSSYFLQALDVWGPFKGSWLGIKRILSCHPWGGHGHDPVPPKRLKP